MKHEIDFALTTYCQARCRSCARTNETTGKKEDWLELKHMDLNVYKRIVETSDIFADKDNIEVTYCGEFGDPMMHPLVNDFIEYTAPRVNILIINTNGGLRKPEWYAEMAQKYSNLRINWGVDGADHDTNWLYREGVDWQRAMDNMRAWFSNTDNGSWQFLIFDWNWHQIPEAKRLAEEMGCEIEFKFNQRSWGLISNENRTAAYALLEEIGEI